MNLLWISINFRQIFPMIQRRKPFAQRIDKVGQPVHTTIEKVENQNAHYGLE